MSRSKKKKPGTITKTQKRDFSTAVVLWFKANSRDFPWRYTRDPYRLLFAELMLRRTRAKQVEPVYNNFIELWQTLDAFLAASDKDVIGALGSLGLSWRTGNILELKKTLEEIPEEYSELVKLPGVGDYVASAICCMAYGDPRAMIDTNSVRVIGRYFGLETGPETRRRKWFKKLAASLVPDESRDYNLGVLDIAALVCKPRDPLCAPCPLAACCKHKRLVEDTRRGSA